MTLKPGDKVMYYPRAGKPGHEVEILSVRPHIFHDWLILFRYSDGRERELTWARFHTTPDA